MSFAHVVAAVIAACGDKIVAIRQGETRYITNLLQEDPPLVRHGHPPPGLLVESENDEIRGVDEVVICCCEIAAAAAVASYPACSVNETHRIHGCGALRAAEKCRPLQL